MILMFMFIMFSLISIILMMLNYLISMNKYNDREKASPFECGFDPFNSSRLPFSIQFYMISIIFLIFDVEIIIFFPMMFNDYNNIWFSTLGTFIWILMSGLYVEWHDGALYWLK